jgi:hypothetical protein
MVFDSIREMAIMLILASPKWHLAFWQSIVKSLDYKLFCVS